MAEHQKPKRTMAEHQKPKRTMDEHQKPKRTMAEHQKPKRRKPNPPPRPPPRQMKANVAEIDLDRITEVTIHHFPTRFQVKSQDYIAFTERPVDIQKLFQHCGSRLTAVSLYEDRKHDANSHYMLRLVKTYCVAGTLKQLKIQGTRIRKEIGIGLKPIFRQLQLLSMIEVYIKCAPDVFGNCDSLIDLRITQSPDCETVLTNNFPKLQRFKYYPDNRFDMESDGIVNSFLRRHPTLKSIHLDACWMAQLSVSKISVVCRDLEELEIKFDFLELDFRYFLKLKRLRLYPYKKHVLPIVNELDKLQSLESLTLATSFYNKEVFTALPQMKNLRELDVTLDHVSERIQWSSLTQLKKLRLANRHDHTIRNIVDIIRQLINLEELEVAANLGSSFILRENELSEIVNVVKDRQHVLQLKCKFTFSQSSETYLQIFGENSKVQLIKNEGKM